MRVLLLGGTGDIGAAVADELATAGHDVLALARSPEAAAALAARGFATLRGDLRAPEAWAGAVRDVDALVHAAGVFTDEMAAIDRRLLDALLAQAAGRPTRLRFLYTGGCWLYGDTASVTATETSPYRPIPAFAYMVEGAQRLLAAPEVDALILHPAMVYARNGGVLARFLETARRERRVEVWGGLDNHWPVVERRDAAAAYRLVLERAPAGETYTAAAEPAVRVGDIVRAIERRFDLTRPPRVRPVADAIREHGAWALGPSLDQRLSGRKLAALGWRPATPDILAAIA